MSNTKCTYFIYLRKSTDDTSRQIRSIHDQESELRELAQREALTVVETFTEKQTAKLPGRPVFNEMLRRIEAGHASGILAWHPDRLARNSLDGGRLIYLIDIGVIKDMRFPTFTFESTASGKLMLGMMFGQSKYYVDNLSENIKRGIRQKVQNGIWPAAAPVGYRNDSQNRTITIDPERGPLVKHAFELYATGNYPLSQITKTINEMGLTGIRGGTLMNSSYHRLLQNPIYYGMIRHKGELHEGNHEPLITKTLFDQVQAVMNQKSRPKSPSGKSYLYRGMFHCGECDCMITNETQKGHVYLRCTKKKKTCSQRYLREEEMTRQVERILQSWSLSSADADWILERLKEMQARENSIAEKARDTVKTELENLASKMERLQESYLEGISTLEEFRSTKTRLATQKATLKERLAAIDENSGNRLEPVVRFVKASKKLGFLARNEKNEEKRDWLKKIGSNRKLVNGELVLSARGAWKKS